MSLVHLLHWCVFIFMIYIFCLLRYTGWFFLTGPPSSCTAKPCTGARFSRAWGGGGQLKKPPCIKVDSSTATRSENKYETVAETYPDVTFTFQISRRSPSYRWSSQNGSFLDPCHNFVSLPERQLSSRAFWQCCSLSPRSSFLQLPEKRLLWIQSAF